MRKKRILVAPLNWGLGHASRCVPVITSLQDIGFEPIIASDGDALELLKLEFPDLTHIELPSYNIRYPNKGENMKRKLMLETPRILKTINQERKITEDLASKLELEGIISDNRWGVRSKRLKTNVFMTHQLNVLSGSTTFLSSFIHRQYIKRFDQCWVPDFEGTENLSGIMGHPTSDPLPVKYMGVLSRLKKRELPVTYDFVVLLSGPEPQRTKLEHILLRELETIRSRVLFVRGKITEKKEINSRNRNIHIQNYLYGKSLEDALNSTNFVISRPGYTTLMDLSKLEKKAFFIPTPGQPEQEYLGRRLYQKNIAPFCKQDEFRWKKIEEIEAYQGLSDLGNSVSFQDLFAFFESE
ncbi:glycosyltransferase [Gramella sp. GC03-9]|uniref:Glycosyltransferase n=1 Tax=Christiangramia oceanisediminis TaxID=2920386 RepID=A0A9X2KX97_9FLAO|nr:glycosyltransferase [Gramella oceanisediminis]MCP9198736.1 glycosyltransferase [Gramella oceanisediminis]